MNVFDIIGPVMIGPSSSHTAGAARIGKLAAMLLEQPVAKVDILLHGSFARTYKGHGTDKALIGGILKLEPWNEDIRYSLDLAGQRGIQVNIETGVIENAHPNTALVTLTDQAGDTVSVQGSSIGGGNIVVTKLNGMDVWFTGQRATMIVLHQDMPGVIARVTGLVAEHRTNICNMRLGRQEKGGTAVMTVEADSPFNESLAQQIRALEHVYHVTVFRIS